MESKLSVKFVRVILSMALLSLMLVGTVVEASAASIIYVKMGATGANNGTSWANAYKSLQKALAHAPAGSGDQIWVAKGRYTPTALSNPSDPRSATFTLKNGVALYGGFAGTETLLSQRKPAVNVTLLDGDIGIPLNNTDNSYHVVTANATVASAVLDGFYIGAGNANSGTPPDSEGGGILIISGKPTLRNLVIAFNAASLAGGGLYNQSSNPTLTSVTFTGNSADLGGGMYNYSSSPALTRVTFSTNTATSWGGGMANQYSNPILANVSFTGNSAALYGGGMFNNYSGSPRLTNVSFTSNTTPGSGGGMYNLHASNPSMVGGSFSSNSAAYGGGLYDDGSNPALKNVMIAGNVASSDGGGLENLNGSSPTLTNVSFIGNTAPLGGGLENLNGSSPTLTDVTFNGNAATLGGGGVFNDGGSDPLLTDVTLSGNTAGSASGGGMYNYASSPTLTNVTFSGNSAFYASALANSTGSNPQVRNSIFWNDGVTEIVNDTSAPDFANSIIAGGCPSGSNSCTNISVSDPVLGPLQNNGGFTMTMALGAGSAAIDAGDNASCAAKDQRGVSRPQGEFCDIGAYEVKALVFVSQAAYDGQLLESAKGSNVGGSLNNTAGTFHVGDDKLNRRFRGLLSFNTASLPDGATIVQARLGVRQQTAPVGNPFGTQGSFVVDLAKPYFGSALSLQTSDWQAAATVASAGPFLADSTWYWALLNSAGLSRINKVGTTQLRLLFSGPDAYNGLPDYLTLYSGNATTASNRPFLTVYYNP